MSGYLPVCMGLCVLIYGRDRLVKNFPEDESIDNVKNLRVKAFQWGHGELKYGDLGF